RRDERADAPSAHLASGPAHKQHRERTKEPREDLEPNERLSPHRRQNRDRERWMVNVPKRHPPRAREVVKFVAEEPIPPAERDDERKDGDRYDNFRGNDAADRHHGLPRRLWHRPLQNTERSIGATVRPGDAGQKGSMDVMTSLNSVSRPVGAKPTRPGVARP